MRNSGKIPFFIRSDYELILIEWEDVDTQNCENTQVAMSGCSIKNLLEDDKLLQVV